MPAKRLILKLSSLGDVILASSALETTQLNHSFDWVVAQEYRELLSHHPKINQVLSFDRSSGLKGWVRFCRKLWEVGYSDIFDLHSSLRTQIMKVLFRVWSASEGVPF